MIQERSLANCAAIITDRVRSTRGGYIFTLCVCPQEGGYLIQLMGGGTPSQAQAGGLPCPAPGGVPCPAPGGEGYPVQVQGGYPVQLQAGGYPVQLQVGGTWLGYSAPGQGTPLARVPPGQGTPQPGYPPSQGTPPARVPHPQPYRNIAWTCYAAVGEPLAC